MTASDQTGLRVSPLVGSLLALPPIGFLVVFFVLPLLSTIRTSTYTYVPPFNAVAHLTGSNYRSFLGDSYYLGILTRTLQISITTTVLAAIIGFPLAYWIGRSSRLSRSIALACVLLPLFVSDVVRTYGWTILLADNGILAQMLGVIGLPAPSVMNTDRGTVIGLVEVLLPFLVLPTVGSIAAIPISLEEAARSLGAPTQVVLLRIVLPLSLPGLAVGSTLVFILSMGAFVTPSLMGGPTVPVIGTLIYNQATTINNWPFASAIGMILLAVVLIVLTAVSLVPRMLRL